MTDPFGMDNLPGLLDGEPTDAHRVVSMDGSVQHIPDPGPFDPYMLWEGELTPAWQAFLRRGNGPYWTEGTALVISPDTEGEEEAGIRVHPGEWVTYLGEGYGFEVGRVYPVFMRTGWEGSEMRVGYILAPEDMPGLLRAMADNWVAPTLPERELAFNVTELDREGK